MTVENKTSKTDKLVMGSKTYSFSFDVLLEDPTDEDAKHAIRCSVSNGETSRDLEYGTEYTVALDSNKKGGIVTVEDSKDNSWTIVVYRQYQETQGSHYRDYNEFPARTLEENIDKITMILQQHKEQIDRSVKVDISDNETPEELLAEVYQKLDSAEAIAAEAQKSADNAAAAVESAAETLVEVTAYVDEAKLQIDNTKTEAIETVTTTANAAIETINTTVSEANASLESTINNAVEEVKAEATAAAEAAIEDAATEATNIATANINAYVENTVKPDLNAYIDQAEAQAQAAAGYAADAATTLSEVEHTAESFNTVYNSKVSDFNANALQKTSAFDSNAAAKQTQIDNTAGEVALLADDASQSASNSAISAENAAASENNAKQSELTAAALAERVRSEGVPMSIIEQRRIEKTENTVKLWWKDPRDTVIDGFVLSSWKSTTIVKKQGSYPEDVDDGVIVEIVTERNRYFNNPLEDTQENAADWYYRAFPLSVNGVYCLDKRNCFGVVLFGYRIDETDPVPSTRVHKLEYCDNYFYDKCVMDFATDQFSWGDHRNDFFIGKPCALKYNGEVDYYLNPEDFNYKQDGTASDVSNTSYGGNFMVEFPAIFMKIWEENNYIYVLVSNTKLDDSFEAWNCKRSDGSYNKTWYYPMFEGTSISNVLRSIATNGKPTSGLNAETESTQAKANGEGWETTTWADEMVLMWLFPLLFESTDSQSVLGAGATASTSALTCNNNAALTKGLMYGTKDRSAAGMTYLGIHNFYGHRWRRPNGLMNDKGNIKVKLTHSTIDGSTTTGFNRTGGGYISTGFVPPAASESYINRYKPLGDGKYGLVPKVVTGSSSTYYCDAMWTNNGQLDQLILGGSVANGLIAGVFCFYVDFLPTSTNWDFGASPSYHRL